MGRTLSMTLARRVDAPGDTKRALLSPQEGPFAETHLVHTAPDERVPFLPPGEQVPNQFKDAVFVVPRRQSIGPDGREGWVAECPSLPLHRGVNPEYARKHSLKAQKYHFAHDALVYLAFFKKDPSAPDPSARVTRFILAPIQNPAGSITSQLALYPFEPQVGGRDRQHLVDGRLFPLLPQIKPHLNPRRVARRGLYI